MVVCTLYVCGCDLSGSRLCTYFVSYIFFCKFLYDVLVCMFLNYTCIPVYVDKIR